MGPRLIRLPRTATRRNAPSHALLLDRVEPHASSYYDFHGKILAPGQLIEEQELWPTMYSPPVPVLLENCQIEFSGRGHHRNPREHILWIYSIKLHQWRQVARCSAYTPEEWIPVIHPVALRYVFPRQKPPEPDLHSAARRIAGAIEAELLQLADNTRRSHLLGHAWDYLAQRTADLKASRKEFQMPLRPHSEDGLDELLQPVMPEYDGRAPGEVEGSRLSSC